MGKEEATYSHGHHPAVVNAHARRTAQESIGFLIPYIKSTDRILDIGCGPGSITADVARLAHQGSVLGADAVASVIEQARGLATEQGVTNLEFEGPIDANALPYADGTFDVVFCHQLLQHVKDPVGILREMHRVAKPGGIVAARESDYAAFAWYPALAGLDRWMALYHQNARANGGEPDAGRFLHAWARQAGFKTESIQSTVTSWCYTADRATQWGEMWAERTLVSGFYNTAIEKNGASEEELHSLSKAWKEWARMEDRWISVPSGEILYRKASQD